jgi:hypothetical protein
LTTVEHLLEEHRRGTQTNRSTHYLDWAANVDRDPHPEVRAAHLMEMDYSIHFHVWKPDSFIEFLVEARKEARLDFEIGEFSPPQHAQDDEFIFVLLKGASQTLRVPQDPGPVRRARENSVRSRIARSAVGPVVRPAYRQVRRLVNRLGSVRQRRSGSGKSS